jgi:hypothetical protein
MTANGKLSAQKKRQTADSANGRGCEGMYRGKTRSSQISLQELAPSIKARGYSALDSFARRR